VTGPLRVHWPTDSTPARAAQKDRQLLDRRRREGRGRQRTWAQLASSAPPTARAAVAAEAEAAEAEAESWSSTCATACGEPPRIRDDSEGVSGREAATKQGEEARE
jgi:hypothetical protein